MKCEGITGLVALELALPLVTAILSIDQGRVLAPMRDVNS